MYKIKWFPDKRTWAICLDGGEPILWANPYCKHQAALIVDVLNEYYDHDAEDHIQDGKSMIQDYEESKGRI